MVRTIFVHRMDKELTGKALSANTLASFLVAQGVKSVADLTVDRVMTGPALFFLNRDRAMGYWKQEGWLAWASDGYIVTPAGLDEVHAREAGEARRKDGGKKAGNVTPELIRLARLFILHGESGHALMLRKAFELPEQPS